MLSFFISDLVSNVQWNDIMLTFKTSDNIVLQVMKNFAENETR